jgi:WD40 repeat protein
MRSPHLPPGARLIHVNIDHISSIAFSGDSTKLALAGWDSYLRLYNVATGTTEHTWIASRRPHVDIAYSPNRNEIAVSHDTVSLSRWDTTTDKEILPPLWPPQIGGYVRYSPDGRLLAASGLVSSSVVVWDIPSGRPRFAVTGFHKYPTALAFSPNGKWLAAADEYAIHLWDTATGKIICTWPDTYTSFIAFSPDSAQVAFGGPFVPIHIIQTATGQTQVTIPEYDIQRAVFAPNGRSLIVAQTGALLAFDLRGRFYSNLSPNPSPPGYLMRIFPPLRTFQRLPISCVTFSPDGRHFAFAYADTVIILPVNRMKLP